MTSKAENRDTAVAACLSTLHARCGDFKPTFGIVLGSGLGGLAEHVTDPIAVAYEDLPGFPISTVPGHVGRLIAGRLGGAPVLMFAGRSHFYEHGRADAMWLPLAVLSAMGAGTLILSNAAGSTSYAQPPGTLMLITDHINWSGRNPLIGTTGDAGFVDMTDAYDLEHRKTMVQVASDQGLVLTQGVYGWFSGPSYETPAEVRMAARLGIDAVGMSTVPETILARALGLRVAAVSLITNLGAGIGDGKLDHSEVKAEGAKAARRFESLIVGFIERCTANATT